MTSTPSLESESDQSSLQTLPPVMNQYHPPRMVPSVPPGFSPLSNNCNLENAPTLDDLLEQLGLTKYIPLFKEQDVDLQVFMSLTDNDLKEVGIK